MTTWRQVLTQTASHTAHLDHKIGDDTPSVEDDTSESDDTPDDDTHVVDDAQPVTDDQDDGGAVTDDTSGDDDDSGNMTTVIASVSGVAAFLFVVFLGIWLRKMWFFQGSHHGDDGMKLVGSGEESQTEDSRTAAAHNLREGLL